MSALGKVLRYWHTLRYLRPVQFYGRLWFWYAGWFFKPKAVVVSPVATDLILVKANGSGELFAFAGLYQKRSAATKGRVLGSGESGGAALSLRPFSLGESVGQSVNQSNSLSAASSTVSGESGGSYREQSIAVPVNEVPVTEVPITAESDSLNGFVGNDSQPIALTAGFVGFPKIKPVSMLGPNRFRFLNQTHDVVGADAWNDPSVDKLWLYNLHYFDDLSASNHFGCADDSNGGGGIAGSSQISATGRITNVGAIDATLVGEHLLAELAEDDLETQSVGQGADCVEGQTGDPVVHSTVDRTADRTRWQQDLVHRWIVENPLVVGNGWEPYPTSLRIVNWVKWLRGSPECIDDLVLRSLANQAAWLRRRLEYHLLGNHLFANAKALVFAGAFFVGREADEWLACGQKLLVREINEQILEDGGHFERSPMYHAILLEDMLDLLTLADLYPGVLDQNVVGLCAEKVPAMVAWLSEMSHPDGEISFFNDAAFGIAPNLKKLREGFAGRLGFDGQAEGIGNSSLANNSLGISSSSAQGLSVQGCGVDLPRRDASGREDLGGKAAGTVGSISVVHLRESGYVRLETGPAVALLDVAPIGPDYLPGHAHADTLSFELSVYGQRVIVNGGTSRYGAGPERLAERGTAAHSTVQIDGVDSSEVWGGFRVARRARPFDVRVAKTRRGFAGESESAAGAQTLPTQVGDSATAVSESSDNSVPHCSSESSYHPSNEATAEPVSSESANSSTRVFEVSAAHDGYCRLPGKPVHRRTWLMTDRWLRVTDRVEGLCQRAVARFHLRPDVKATVSGNTCDTGYLVLSGGKRLEWKVSGGAARVVSDEWHPEFGVSVASQCLEVEFENPGSGSEVVFDLNWEVG